VAGRGELQIAVLIETLRREGYEFAVSRPEVIRREIDGVLCEPVEDVVVEIPERCAGAVMEKLSGRKGRMLSMEQRDGRVRLCFVVPSRGLFGYRGEFLTDTRRGVCCTGPCAAMKTCRRSAAARLGAVVVSEAGRPPPTVSSRSRSARRCSWARASPSTRGR
jgi:predicted membrane GTPase involved in stress response